MREDAKFDENIFEFITRNTLYPIEARMLGHEGSVRLIFLINEEGESAELQLDESSGYEELDMEAAKVILCTQGKWKPGRIHNLPISV